MKYFVVDTNSADVDHIVEFDTISEVESYINDVVKENTIEAAHDLIVYKAEKVKVNYNVQITIK